MPSAMTTSPELDRIDLKILACLQEDGRISNLKLAEAVTLSPTAVLARVQRLTREGVILGYEARLNPLKLGAGHLGARRSQNAASHLSQQAQATTKASKTSNFRVRVVSARFSNRRSCARVTKPPAKRPRPSSQISSHPFLTGRRVTPENITGYWD